MAVFLALRASWCASFYEILVAAGAVITLCRADITGILTWLFSIIVTTEARVQCMRISVPSELHGLHKECKMGFFLPDSGSFNDWISSPQVFYDDLTCDKDQLTDTLSSC